MVVPSIHKIILNDCIKCTNKQKNMTKYKKLNCFISVFFSLLRYLLMIEIY